MQEEHKQEDLKQQDLKQQDLKQQDLRQGGLRQQDLGQRRREGRWGRLDHLSAGARKCPDGVPCHAGSF